MVLVQEVEGKKWGVCEKKTQIEVLEGKNPYLKLLIGNKAGWGKGCRCRGNSPRRRSLWGVQRGKPSRGGRVFLVLRSLKQGGRGGKGTSWGERGKRKDRSWENRGVRRDLKSASN